MMMSPTWAVYWLTVELTEHVLMGDKNSNYISQIEADYSHLQKLFAHIRLFASEFVPFHTEKSRHTDTSTQKRDKYEKNALRQ